MSSRAIASLNHSLFGDWPRKTKIPSTGSAVRSPGLRVFEDGGGQLAVRDFHVHDLGRLKALHAGIAEQGVLRGLRREEAIHDFHHGQLGDAEIQEVQAFVEGAVPAADHEHALAFVRSTVADRAEVHLIAFGGHVQRNGLAAVARMIAGAL